MAKKYLDAEGVTKLVEFFTKQFASSIDLQEEIELLNKTDGTPGSIKQIVDEIIANTSISDLNQDEELTIYGGSASDVMEEVE